MYRGLLAFLVFTVFVLSLAVLVLIFSTDSAYQKFINDPVTIKTNTLSDSQTGSVPTVTGKLVYTNRIATHVYGLVASAVALFFLYRKGFKSTKYMYIPMLVSAVAAGLYAYNAISFSDPSLNSLSKSQQDAEKDMNTPGNSTSRYYDNWYYLNQQLLTLRMDLGTSVGGVLAHLGTILYLFNRRI